MRALSFGPFCLLPSQRMLLENGVPVRLGSRSFDLLVALVERAGQVVPNADLIALVWQSTVVDPGALRVHLTGLRKVLGEGRLGQRYVVNVPLQGYCFVAPVEESLEVLAAGADLVKDADPGRSPTPAASAVAPDVPAALPLPAQVTRLIGRDDIVLELLGELPRRRCITLVGPAGMGKTSVALAVARAAREAFESQVVFVALSPLTDPAQVTASVISALGVPALPADPLRGLLAYVRDRRILILLDNCEHLIEAVATLAEALLTGASGVHLLVTSREPLRIQGEWVQRLTSLPSPPRLARLGVHELLQFSSVELFVERVRAGLDAFELVEADLQPVADICRALDGIPLALELAAAGVERLGVRGVAANLGNRLALLTRGRRTALPQHQTLRAALDWGYALLSPGEKALLRALSIFRSRFTSASVQTLVGRRGDSQVDDDLYSLVSKSLVASDISGDSVQYWLLETTREYAQVQLQECAELDAVAAGHAALMLGLADEAERLRTSVSQTEWQAAHAHLIDDVRAALHWCLSAAGDARLGVALAAASAALWFALSRMAEYLVLAEQALGATQGNAGLDLRREMALQEALGHALWHIRGTGPQALSAFERAVEISDRVGTTADRMRVIWGLWLVSNSSGDYAQNARYAERFGLLAAESQDLGSEIVHHRMMAMSMHFTGRHAQALQHAQTVLDQPITGNLSARNSGFQFDQRATALTALARILWVSGYPQQALERAEQAIQRALDINHSLSLCFALSVGCTPVAFWAGDWERAERYTKLLQDRSKEYSLSFWQVFADGYALVLERRRGATGSVDSLRRPARSLRDTLCTLDPGLAASADFARGESGAVPWCAPELLRIQGERLRQAGHLVEAEALFRAGVAQARGQEALSWELRCALSLAHVLRDTASADSARACLEPVYGRFKEGFDTADLKEAAAFLEALRD